MNKKMTESEMLIIADSLFDHFPADPRRITLEVEHPHNQTVVLKNGHRIVHISLNYGQVSVSAWGEDPITGETFVVDPSSISKLGASWPLRSKPSEIHEQFNLIKANNA